MYDCIVVGGGTAGACAGITAARHGLKTLIVESFGFLGGTQTAALVTPMMATLISDADKANISGLNNEIITALEQSGDGNGAWFNPEALKFVLEEMAVQSGAELLYFTQCIDVETKDGAIHSIKIFNKSGISELRAHYFIDASGDADLAFGAGVPCVSGSAATGKNQHISLRFECGGVSMQRFAEFMTDIAGWKHNAAEMHVAYTHYKDWYLTPLFQAGISEGIIEAEDANYFQMFSIPGKPDCAAFNCPEIRCEHNGINPWNLTGAVIKGHRTIKRLMRLMRAKFPGFEKAYINQVASQVGIRETRRIVGDYVLCAADVVSYKKFDDGIARSNWYMDVHGAEDEREAVESIALADIDERDKYYEIPYRALFSSAISNMLVAGRCISSDFAAQSSYRIIPTCRAIGESAGHAVYLAHKNNCSVQTVDGTLVRAQMRLYGGSY